MELLGGWEGGRERGGGERWRMDDWRKTDCSLAHSLMMNETLKAPRRPRFHVVTLCFIIHLSLSLSLSLSLPRSLLLSPDSLLPSSLPSLLAVKAKKDQKSWKLPINLMKFHQPPAAILDMESRGRGGERTERRHYLNLFAAQAVISPLRIRKQLNGGASALRHPRTREDGSK